MFRSTVCPWCGKRNNRVTAVEHKAKPKSGDLTICIDCGEWAVFGFVPGGLRKPTDAEFVEIGTDDTCQKVRRAWVAMKESEATA